MFEIRDCFRFVSELLWQNVENKQSHSKTIQSKTKTKTTTHQYISNRFPELGQINCPSVLHQFRASSATQYQPFCYASKSLTITVLNPNLAKKKTVATDKIIYKTHTYTVEIQNKKKNKKEKLNVNETLASACQFMCMNWNKEKKTHLFAEQQQLAS